MARMKQRTTGKRRARGVRLRLYDRIRVAAARAGYAHAASLPIGVLVQWLKATHKLPENLKSEDVALLVGPPDAELEAAWAEVIGPPPMRQKRHLRKAAKRTPDLTDEVRDKFYASWDWKRLRYDVIQERGRKCECCNRTAEEHGIVINVDHIKPIRHHWHLRLVKGNLQILCQDCNMGKGSRDETDWRAPPAAPSPDAPPWSEDRNLIPFSPRQAKDRL